MIKFDQMREIATGRAKTYAFLAGLFTAPPAPKLAAQIRAGGFVPEPGSALTAAAAALTECFRQMERDDVPDNDIVAEHTGLFGLPAGVVPHESYYLDSSQRVGGHVTVEVQRFYDMAAVRFTDDCLELADYVGVELEFMKFLCEIEAQFWEEQNWEGLGKCIEFQRGFLEGHLLRWYQALCERIVAQATLDLYRALSRLTKDFLDAERAFVPGLAEEIRSEGRNVCVCN